MAGWHLAPSLVALRQEINAMFPKRDKSSDGALGDEAHAARKSDHNPDWDAPGARRGVVRAIDVDIDDNDPRLDLRTILIGATVRDPRVWYVISNGIIRSRTYGWAARRYTGPNGHFKHVHISINGDQRSESDTSRWITATVPPPVPAQNLLSRAALERAAFDDAMSGEWAKDRAQFLAWAYTRRYISYDMLMAPYRGHDWSGSFANAVRGVQAHLKLRQNGRIDDAIVRALKADGYVITA